MSQPPEFWQDLLDRDIVQQSTSDQLGNWLVAQLQDLKPPTLYAGFDPTASSLHIGSLMPVVGLKRFRKAGFKPIALVGGATGMIGDPSGKAAERQLLQADLLAENVAGLQQQLERLLEGEAGKDFIMVNNHDWISQINIIEFLRDVGKHFSVNMMINRDSVKSRLENREQGISYTEFSYMLLQAYDFLHLFNTYNCKLQVGGSDQWGNITAGIDLIKHKHHRAEVHGCTFPLITTSSGQKFGKSEKGAIWLDANRTFPYFLYKYFFDTEDADVIRFLKYFTFLPIPDIAQLAEQVQTQPQQRAAQKALAFEVTSLVHGPSIAQACAGLESAMHQGDEAAVEQHAQTLGLLDPAAVAQMGDQATGLPVLLMPRSQLAAGLSAIDLAVSTGLFNSKGEVRREINSGNSGFRVAGQPVSDVELRITTDTLGSRRVLQLSKGKRNKRMICFYEE